MGKKPRTKMPVAQRAKQFAPFKALDGLDRVLRQAEEEHRRELEGSGVVSVPDEEYTELAENVWDWMMTGDQIERMVEDE